MIIALENIRSLYNVGSIFRTASFFGIKNSQDLIKFSQKNKLKLVAVEQDKQAIGLQEWQPEKNSVLVLGNELQGCSLKVLRAAEEIVEIPRLGKKGSLNVSVAAGIILAQIRYKLNGYGF